MRRSSSGWSVLFALLGLVLALVALCRCCPGRAPPVATQGSTGEEDEGRRRWWIVMRDQIGEVASLARESFLFSTPAAPSSPPTLTSSGPVYTASGSGIRYVSSSPSSTIRR